MDMEHSVKVTIRPHITEQRCVQMVRMIAERLWPNAAGGAQMLTEQQIRTRIFALAGEVKRRNQAIALRVKRKGMQVSLEPLGVIK